MPLTPEASTLVGRWNYAQRELATRKAEEFQLRQEVVATVFPSYSFGVNTVDLGKGWALKAEFKLNYKLAENGKVDEAMVNIRKVGNYGTFMADELFKWTPSLHVPTYKKLQAAAAEGSPEAQQVLAFVNHILEIKPAATALAVVAPKSE